MQDLAIQVAAVASLSRLVAADSITSTSRHKAVKWARRHRSPLVAEIEFMAGCPFCVSMWAAVAVAALWRVRPGRALCRLLAWRWLAAVARLQLDPHGIRDWPEGTPWPGDVSHHPMETTLPQLKIRMASLQDRVKQGGATVNLHTEMDMVAASIDELTSRAAE